MAITITIVMMRKVVMTIIGTPTRVMTIVMTSRLFEHHYHDDCDGISSNSVKGPLPIDSRVSTSIRQDLLPDHVDEALQGCTFSE